MTTLRNRRVLSAHRRLGPQGSDDALAGRAQRHALGWRDCANDNDVLSAADKALIAVGMLIVTWSVIAGGIWLAVLLIG